MAATEHICVLMIYCCKQHLSLGFHLEPWFGFQSILSTECSSPQMAKRILVDRIHTLYHVCWFQVVLFAVQAYRQNVSLLCYILYYLLDFCRNIHLKHRKLCLIVMYSSAWQRDQSLSHRWSRGDTWSGRWVDSCRFLSHRGRNAFLTVLCSLCQPQFLHNTSGSIVRHWLCTLLAGRLMLVQLRL